MHAVEAALAAEAAGLQGHFWEMHDFLYKYQSGWSKASNVRPFLMLMQAASTWTSSDSEKIRTVPKSERAFSPTGRLASRMASRTLRPCPSTVGSCKAFLPLERCTPPSMQRSLKTKTISWPVFGRGLLMPRIQLHAAAVPAAGFRAVALFLPSAWRISGSSPHNPWAVPSEKVTELLLNSACKEDRAR